MIELAEASEENFGSPPTQPNEPGKSTPENFILLPGIIDWHRFKNSSLKTCGYLYKQFLRSPRL